MYFFPDSFVQGEERMQTVLLGKITRRCGKLWDMVDIERDLQDISWQGVCLIHVAQDRAK